MFFLWKNQNLVENRKTATLGGRRGSGQKCPRTRRENSRG